MREGKRERGEREGKEKRERENKINVNKIVITFRLGHFNLIFCFSGWPLLRIGLVGRLVNENKFN